VQFKMAGSPRALQLFYRLYFGFWIPALVWAADWWPLWLMYWMARWLVIVPFALLRPKYMRAVRGNYARILGLPPTHPQVRRTSWRMMFEHAYHWIDFFRWSQRPADALQANVAQVEGWERFEAVRRSRRGTLLLTAHMGNPEVGAVAMGKHFEPVHVLYWRDRFATAEKFRTRMRLKGNVYGIPVDATPLSVVPALRVLREGGLLAAHGDRDFNDQGWPVPFFGAPAKFPPGPFLLAARSEAVVIPMFFLVERDRRFHVILEEPIEFSGEENVEACVHAGLERWVRILEHRIRANPEQWFCFYPFWGASQPEAAGQEAACQTVRA
jgi:lauroyl/myristoyl acyltransferase